MHLLCCEDDISKHCLYEGYLSGEFITQCNEKAVKMLIKRSEEKNSTLDSQEKALLFKVISEKCRELKLSQKVCDWQLFVNAHGTAKALKTMFAPIADSAANTLMADYVISSDELNAAQKEIEAYMLTADKVYYVYILAQWGALLSKWESLHTNDGNNDGSLSHIYNIVHFFYDAAQSAYKLEKSKGNIKAVAPSCISGENVRYILSGGKFKTQNDVFYNKALRERETYELINKIFVCNLPSFDYINTYGDDPFKTHNSHIKDLTVKSEVMLSSSEITTLLDFCKTEKENFFSHFKITEQNGMFKVSSLDTDEWVFASTSEDFRNTVLTNCAKAVVLPPSLASYNTMEGLATTEFVYEKLLATANGDTDKLLELLAFVQREARVIKQIYVNHFNSLIISSESFTTESNYTKLFCLFAELKDEDGLVDKLRRSIKIKGNGNENIALDDISMQGTVAVGTRVFDMDALMQDDKHTIQKLAASTLSSMRLCTIDENFLNSLFCLNETISAKEVYNELDTNTALVNKEQLAFMMKYAYINNLTEASFMLKNKQNEPINITNSSWVICDFCFIDSNFILSSIYDGFYSYLDDAEKQKLPFGVNLYDSSRMLNFVKETLTSEEKIALLNHLYNTWDKEHRLMSDSELALVKKALCIDSEELIYAPSNYLLNNEMLPRDVLRWIETNNDEHTNFVVRELAVPDESNEVIAIRKYLNGGCLAPIVSTLSILAQQKTCRWIKHNTINLSTSQFTFLQSVFTTDYYSVCVDENQLSSYCIEENMGHRTKRIREGGDEKHRKSFIYKELRGLRI